MSATAHLAVSSRWPVGYVAKRPSAPIFPDVEKPALLNREEQAIASKILSHKPGQRVTQTRLRVMDVEDLPAAEGLVSRGLAGFDGRAYYLTVRGLDALQGAIGTLNFGTVE